MIIFQDFNEEIIRKRRWYQLPSFMFVGCEAEITRGLETYVFTFAPMECNYCDNECIRKGFYKTIQRFFCKSCKRYQQNRYTYTKCTKEHERLIMVLNNEGASISSISRVTGVSKAHTVNKLREIATNTVRRPVVEEKQKYEIDELRTYIGNKDNECWIIYAINKTTKQVIDFTVGRRTRENINKVIEKLKMLNPKRIFTDKLNIYPGLIDKTKHIASAYLINHIERKNLDLRKDLKCLNRKTICYSKSEEMLEAKLKIYFFGNSNFVY